jgi:hypothetical protein
MLITNLLTNMIVLTIHSTIPDSTPSFQEYALRTTFIQASNMSANWNLDLPKPITTNMVTHVAMEAAPIGIQGSIEISNRFWFSWLYGGQPSFSDKKYDIVQALTPDVKVNDAIFERWMRATNLLTMKRAEQIAKTAMTSIGLPLDKLNFKAPKEMHQENYQWTDGKVYPLPYYYFVWKTQNAYCHIEVSGICSNVVHFAFVGYPYLRFAKPTNYFEMLGLPTNAVFVHPYYAQPGKPPLYELRGSN